MLWTLPLWAIAIGGVVYFTVGAEAPEEERDPHGPPDQADFLVSAAASLVDVLSGAAGDAPPCLEGPCQLDPDPKDSWETAGTSCGKVEGLASPGADFTERDRQLGNTVLEVCATVYASWEAAMEDARSEHWLGVARAERDKLAEAVAAGYEERNEEAEAGK